MRCDRVDLWVFGHAWVKFTHDPEPIRKALLGDRLCPNAATRTARNADGFVFHWCDEHAKDPICNATVDPTGPRLSMPRGEEVG